MQKPSPRLLRVIVGLLLGCILGVVLFESGRFQWRFSPADISQQVYCCNPTSLACSPLSVGQQCTSNVFGTDLADCNQRCAPIPFSNPKPSLGFCCSQTTTTASCNAMPVGQICPSGITSTDVNSCNQQCTPIPFGGGSSSQAAAQGYCCNPQNGTCTAVAAQTASSTGGTNSSTAVSSIAANSSSTGNVNSSNNSSLAACGIRPAGLSGGAAITGDGRYVAFTSIAKNILPGATNAGAFDVLVYDRQAKQTTRVSIATNGAETPAGSYNLEPAISDNGQYVTFVSGAANLVSGDTNGRQDVFIRNRSSNQTIRIDLGPGHDQPNGDSEFPAISSDGKYIAYASFASNIDTSNTVPDTNGKKDIFVYNQINATSTRISNGTDGANGNGISAKPSISADGGIIAFSSTSTNLVLNDTNGKSDVFIYDAGQIKRVSVSTQGAQGNDDSDSPVVSRDGRFVAFASKAKNLTPNPTTNSYDIYLYDTLNQTTINLSRTLPGMNVRPSISGDGRFIAFVSFSTNLNGGFDVQIYDRDNGTVTAMTDATMGSPSNDYPSISIDGRYVAFTSAMTTLVPGINETQTAGTNVYVYDRVNHSFSLGTYNYIPCP